MYPRSTTWAEVGLEMHEATSRDDVIWLKTATVAGLLGHSPETVIAWARDGRIPAHRFRKLPKEYRFHREWVQDPVLLVLP